MIIQKILIIISTVFSISHLFSQDYVPTLVEGAKWSEISYFEGATPLTIIAGGDTIINNQVYKKFEGAPYLREDTIERKIYVLWNTDPFTEEVLYDYSLKIGDFFENLRLDSISNELTFAFSEIQSFSLNTRVYYLSTIPPTGGIRTWIQGIGANNGLLRGANSDYLLCHENGNGNLDLSVQPLNIPEVQNCMIVLSVNEIPDLFQGNIFPNPASSNIQTKTKEFIQDGQIKISDIYGKIVKTTPFIGEELDIDVHDLSEGIYIMQLYNSGDLVGVRKFVKM